MHAWLLDLLCVLYRRSSAVQCSGSSSSNGVWVRGAVQRGADGDGKLDVGDSSRSLARNEQGVWLGCAATSTWLSGCRQQAYPPQCQAPDEQLKAAMAATDQKRCPGPTACRGARRSPVKCRWQWD